MAVTVAVIAMSAAVAVVWNARSDPRPGPRIPGWLHTDGTTIRDSRNRPVRLLSLGITGMNRTARGGWSVPTEATYDNVAAWGFNSVRVPITWANLEPEPPGRAPDGSLIHRYDIAYLEAIDAIVGEFEERGIAVILVMSQWHWSPAFRVIEEDGRVVWGKGMPAWLYPDGIPMEIGEAKREFFANEDGVWEGFIDAWKVVAARYANEPTVVGFDVLNEPYYEKPWFSGPEELHLPDLYERIGRAIREVNPSVLLIFEDSQYRPGLPFALEEPPAFRDVVYSFHLYTDNWDPEGVDRYEAFWDRAKAWNVPMWIGEFNRFGKHPDSMPDWSGQLELMLARFEEEGVSWSYWSYHGPDRLADSDDQLANPELLRIIQSGY